MASTSAMSLLGKGDIVHLTQMSTLISRVTDPDRLQDLPYGAKREVCVDAFVKMNLRRFRKKPPSSGGAGGAEASEIGRLKTLGAQLFALQEVVLREETVAAECTDCLAEAHHTHYALPRISTCLKCKAPLEAYAASKKLPYFYDFLEPGQQGRSALLLTPVHAHAAMHAAMHANNGMSYRLILHSDYAGTMYVRHCKYCDIMFEVDGYQFVKSWNKADEGLKLAYLPEHRNQRWLRGSAETVISAAYVPFFTAAMQTMHAGFSQVTNLVNYVSSIVIEKRSGKGESWAGWVVCYHIMLRSR